MADIKAHGSNHQSFPHMTTYSALNEALGIEYFNALWNRHSQA